MYEKINNNKRQQQAIIVNHKTVRKFNRFNKQISNSAELAQYAECS